MQNDADGGAERGAGRDAGHVGVGERVEEEVLQDHAGDRERRADEGRRRARAACGSARRWRCRGRPGPAPPSPDARAGSSDSETGPRASASTRHAARMPAARRMPGHVPVRARRVTALAYASGWIICGELPEALGQARAGTGDEVVVDDVDVPVLDGGEVGEAGALLDVAGLAHRPGVGDVDGRVVLRPAPRC